MCFSNSTSVLSMETFFPCFLTITGNLYAHHACTLKQYNSTDTFQTNWKEILNYLSYQTPLTGFGLGSKGEGQERVYGLALCRPDKPPATCGIGLAQAIDDLDKRCQYYNGGVIWYNLCQLKCSNRDCFSQVDNANRYQRGNETVSDSAPMDKKISELIEQNGSASFCGPKNVGYG